MQTPKHSILYYIYTLSFFSGMCIMAVELSASRLMAPYFGTSTFVWTNIIGIIMIALSIGYMWGGNIADKKPHLQVLLKLIITACVILFFVPFVTKWVIALLVSGLKVALSASLLIFFGSMLAIFALFFIPILILGMVSPFLIRILSEYESVGTSAGRIFGISTIGSILGTFLPTLVFVPYIGTSKTILAFSSILFVVAVFGFFKVKMLGLLFLLVIPWFSPYQITVHGDKNVVYETESPYQYIRVVDRGPFRFLVYNLDVGAQSIEHRHQTLTGYYFDYYSLLPILQKSDTENTLLIGSAGGVILKQFQYLHPNVSTEGVEIDEKVIEISRTYFDLPDSIPVHHQDGRIFLEQTDKTYDIIIVDAYSNQLYIPFHLSTTEFFQTTKEHLDHDGIVAMNVNAYNENSKLLNSITNTLTLVFDHVYYYKIKSEHTFNYVIIASDDELDFNELVDNAPDTLRELAVHTHNNATEAFYDSSYGHLTDDKAPLEYLTDWEIVEYVFSHSLD